MTRPPPVARLLVRLFLRGEHPDRLAMIALLLRIGTLDARAVLDETARSTNQDRAMMARGALARFVERQQQ